jgi:hypothetical protein
MEVKVTDQGTFELMIDKWDIMLNMLAIGFTLALIVMVVVAGAKLGMRFWPWVLLLGCIVFWLS